MDPVDPPLNAVIGAVSVADSALQTGNLFSTLVNTLNIITGNFLKLASLFLNSFISAITTVISILQPIFWAGLYSFFIFWIVVLFKGGKWWLKGLSLHLDCAGQQYKQGWENQGKVLNILAPCSWEKFVNFLNGNCTRYYIVDMVFGIIYGIFVELPLVLVKAIFGIDLKIIVEIITNIVIIPLDTLFFMLSGFHLVRWSDNVINTCYRCKGKYKLSNGREITLYKTFADWAKLFKCGHQQIIDGGMRIFTSLLPSEKWWSWANSEGRNLHPQDSKWEPKAWGGAFGY